MKKGLRVQALVGGSMEPGQNPLQRLRLPDGSGSIAAASWLQGAGVMGERERSLKRRPASVVCGPWWKRAGALGLGQSENEERGDEQPQTRLRKSERASAHGIDEESLCNKGRKNCRPQEQKQEAVHVRPHCRNGRMQSSRSAIAPAWTRVRRLSGTKKDTASSGPQGKASARLR